MKAPTDFDEHELELLNPDGIFEFDWLGPTEVDSRSEGEPGNGSSKEKKMAKNDIKRFIPKMFLNAINGGNYQHTQTFADTFIAPQCRLTASFNIPPHFHMPSQVVADGPLQFGHYILGYLQMFPDMVMTIFETSIASSPDAPGSKIVMDVEYSLTKTAHIPYELWIPSLDLIESLYRADTGWQLLHIIRHPHLYRSPASRLILPSSSSDDLPNTLSGKSLSSGDSAKLQQQSQQHGSSSSTPIEGEPHSAVAAAAALSSASASASASAFAGAAPLTCSSRSSNSSGGGGGGSSGKSAPVATTPTRVPERFARALQQAAAPVYQPLALQLRGQVIFHLDEANHIVLMETHMTAV